MWPERPYTALLVWHRYSMAWGLSWSFSAITEDCRLALLPDVLAEWFGRSLEELEKALSLATPAMLTAVHQLGETEPVDRSASLHAFRDASEALDRAIKALEDKET